MEVLRRTLLQGFGVLFPDHLQQIFGEFERLFDLLRFRAAVRRPGCDSHTKSQLVKTESLEKGEENENARNAYVHRLVALAPRVGLDVPRPLPLDLHARARLVLDVLDEHALYMRTRAVSALTSSSRGREGYECEARRGEARRACSRGAKEEKTRVRAESRCREREEKRRTHARTDDLGADVKVAQRFQLDREFLLGPAALHVE